MTCDQSFGDRVVQYLKRYGDIAKINDKYKFSENILPFEVKNNSQKFAVFAYDWKKSIGTDVLIRLENQIDSLDTSYDGAIIIGKAFSGNALDIIDDINKRGNKTLILVRLSEIDTILNDAR